MKKRSDWRMVSGWENLPQYLMLAREQASAQPDPKQAGWGFTTGSAMVAAALASWWALDSEIVISTCDNCLIELESFEYQPEALVKFDNLNAQLKFEDLDLDERPWRCIYKNAGEDPDCTDGLLVAARSCKIQGIQPQVKLEKIKKYADGLDIAHCFISASQDNPALLCLALRGIGTVTKQGLKQEVGTAAINPGPQNMLQKAFSYESLKEERESDEKDFAVLIYLDVPEGQSIARKTFNERLGICGGISILGTSGFVRPMSQEALINSLILELDQRMSSSDRILMAFGARGEKHAQALLGIGPEASLQVSNYIGILFDHALKQGASHIVIAGHPGKLIKLTAGIVYTHSLVADGRREILACEAALMGAESWLIQALYEAPTTDAAYELIEAAGLEGFWQRLSDKALERMQNRAIRLLDEAGYQKLQLEIIMLKQDGELLARSIKQN